MNNEERHAARYPDHWCRSTLHFRGWSAEEIDDLLGDPDIIDTTTNPGTTARYYRTNRALQVEPKGCGYNWATPQPALNQKPAEQQVLEDLQRMQSDDDGDL